MSNERRERFVTVSGLNGYFQLLPEELKAYRVEFYFSASNVGETNYYSYEWYKERSLYGRFKLARGEYTLKERLVQYQNELFYTEEATLNETVKRLQCGLQKQYEVNKFVVEAIIKVAAGLNLTFEYGTGSTGFDQIPPQPIGIPGLAVDGCYYNMFPGCAGKVTIMTWYDADICNDVNGNPLTKDNHGKPPTPSSAGRPPAGSPGSVPPPDYAPGGSHQDDPTTPDVPTDIIKDPKLPDGFVGTLYRLTYEDKITATGEVRATPTIVITGKYSGLIEQPIGNSNSLNYVIQTGIGVAGVQQPNYVQLGSTPKDQNGVKTITITILSIVPQ